MNKFLTHKWKLRTGVSVGVGVLVQVLNGGVDLGLLFIPAFLYLGWGMYYNIKGYN